MTHMEKTLRKALALLEDEQYGKAATLLDEAADGEGAQHSVFRHILDELEGDPESAVWAITELLGEGE